MKADILHSLTGQQYYVLKFRGKLIIKSSLQLKILKSRGLLNKNLTWLRLQEIAIYKTPCGIKKESK